MRVFALALLGACGGEPDGGLLEVHASLDPAVAAETEGYRVYRVILQGGADEAVREVEARGDPPDVFVVRSPITRAGPGDAYSIYVRVQVLRFSLEVGEIIAGCAEQGDVEIIDGAVNVLPLTLLEGDCP